jgi:excisionase family DNA binding protein
MIVDVQEAANHFRIAASTLYGLAKARKVPHLRVGDRVMFDLEKLEKALTVEPQSDKPLLVRGKARR